MNRRTAQSPLRKFSRLKRSAISSIVYPLVVGTTLENRAFIPRPTGRGVDP
jgi:hypothetical protein